MSSIILSEKETEVFQQLENVLAPCLHPIPVVFILARIQSSSLLISKTHFLFKACVGGLDTDTENDCSPDILCDVPSSNHLALYTLWLMSSLTSDQSTVNCYFFTI